MRGVFNMLSSCNVIKIAGLIGGLPPPHLSSLWQVQCPMVRSFTLADHPMKAHASPNRRRAMNPLGADSQTNSHVKKACKQQPTMIHRCQGHVPNQLLQAKPQHEEKKGW